MTDRSESLLIRDHGPGVCEVEGCENPRHLFKQRNHYAPVCATHAWERIRRALADTVDEDVAADVKERGGA
jgi:hypothetical protein